MTTAELSPARNLTKFSAVEACRGIACVMVLFYHCGVAFGVPPIAIYGSSGVHFFFVLSGYLLYRPYAAALASDSRLPSLSNYLKRRLIRILPSYWVALALFVALRFISHNNPPSRWDIAAHALLIFNYDARINYFGINAVFWSLAIEIQYYLLLPLVVAVVARARSLRSAWMPPILFLVIGLFARAAEVTLLNDVYRASVDHIRFRSVFAHLDFFAFGMAVAALQLGWNGRQLKRIRPAAVAFAGALLCLLANAWSSEAAGGAWQQEGSRLFLIAFPPVLCGGCALLLLAVLMNEPARLRRLLWPPLLWLGQISYSLYLYHIGVQFFVFRLGLGRQWSWTAMAWTNGIVSLVLATAVASVMFYLVEWPSLRWIESIRSKPQAAAIQPAGLSADVLLGP